MSVKTEEKDETKETVPETDETVEEKSEETEPETSPYDDLAEEMGWIPKEKYKGDPDEWTDARTFLKKSAEITKKEHNISERLKAELESLKTDVRKSIKFQQETAKREIEKLTAELNEAKRNAIKEGDVEEVEKIDKKISEIEDSLETEEVSQEDNEKIFREWHKTHSWYTSDKRLTRLADGIAQEGQKEGLSYSEILELIDSEMKQYMTEDKTEDKPNKTTPRQGVNDVMKGGHASKGKAKKSFSDLPPMYQEVCDRMVKQGVFKDRQAYVDSVDFSKI